LIRRRIYGERERERNGYSSRYNDDFRPSPNKDKATEKLESMKKSWYELLKTDEGIADRFNEYVKTERVRRQPASVVAAEGELLQVPSQLKKGNPKRNQMPSDHRKRKKTS